MKHRINRFPLKISTRNIEPDGDGDDSGTPGEI